MSTSGPETATDERRAEPDGRDRRFAIALVAGTVTGLAIRLYYALVTHAGYEPLGDPFFYHFGANLLADGGGFLQPYVLAFGGVEVPAADHPPLYMTVLAVTSVAGLRSVSAHLVVSCLIGAATIPVVGLLGRRIGGRRVGVIAAGLTAVAPQVWLYDGMLLSETLAILLATLAVLLTYRAAADPGPARFALLGIVIGAAALTRAELALLVPLLVWPVAARVSGRTPRSRIGLAALATVAAVAVTLPWVAYNLTRFEHPVFLSVQLEATLAGANCTDTYSGAQLGGLTSTCLAGIDVFEDQSVNARILRARVREFVGANLDRLPVVVAARVGRITGVFRPRAQLDLDAVLEGRERPVAVAATVGGAVATLLAIAGAVALRRRRRIAVWPLAILPGLVLLTVALTYGTNRFRAIGETSLLVLAAVAIDAGWRRLRTRRRRPTPG